MQISSATRKKGCIQDIPASYYPGERDTEVQTPVKTRWWCMPTEEVRCKRCKGCDKVQAQDVFNFGK
jgi:hypothetical protein